MVASPQPGPAEATLSRTIQGFFKVESEVKGKVNEFSPPPMMRFLMAGAGAGAITKTCVAPLERLKILFQVQAMQSGAPKYQGIPHATRTIFKEEGVIGFWRGNGANVLRVIPVYALKFGFNDTFKGLVRKDKQTKLNFVQLVTAGSMAGLFQTCITYPLELVRTRLTLGVGLGLRYNGIVDCLMKTLRGEGITGLYKGLSPTILSGVPYVGLQMSFYELNTRFAREHFSLESGTMTKLICGASAGVAAQTLTYAGDTIRRRMQTDGACGKPRTYGGMFVLHDCFRQILKKEGAIGFYKGVHVNCIRAIPGAAIQFVAYDALKSLFGATK
eukprot:GSMAST32.ASY1.ANO1.508.1 assembled CDS